MKLKVKVKDNSGESAVGVEVLLNPTWRSMTVDEKGYVEFGDLSANEYTVVAGGGGYEQGVVSILFEHDQELDFTLNPRRTL